MAKKPSLIPVERVNANGQVYVDHYEFQSGEPLPTFEEALGIIAEPPIIEDE